MAEESKEKRIFHASNGDDYDLDAVLKDYDLNKSGYTQWAIYLDANSPFKKKKNQSSVTKEELDKAYNDVIAAASGNLISSWDGDSTFSIDPFSDREIDWNDTAHRHALRLYGKVLRKNNPMAKPTLWRNDNIGTIDYNNIIPSYSDQSWYGVNDATSRSNFAKIVDKEIADYQNNKKRVDFSNSPYANQQAYIDALTNFKELLTGGTDIDSLRDLWLSLGGKNDVFDKWFGKEKPLPNYDYKAEIDSKIQAMKDRGVVLTEDEEKLLRESYEALGRALAMGLTNDDYAQFLANLLSNVKDNNYKLQLQSWRQQYKKPIRMTTGIMTGTHNSNPGAADRNLDKLLSDSNGKNAFDKFWNDLKSYFNGNSSIDGQELSKRTIKLGKNTYNISAYYGNLLNRLLLDLNTAAENFIPINDNEFIIKETIDRKTGSAIKYDRRSGTYTKYHVSPDSPALEEYLKEAWSKDYDRKSRWSKNGGKLEKINMLRNGSILKAGLGDALNKEAKRVLDSQSQLNQEAFNKYKLDHPDATMQEFVRENKKASETKSRWYEDLRDYSTGLDIASAVSSFAPVIGNAAGVIGGSVATIGNTIADIADPNVSWGSVAGNLALNAGLTGAMLIPGGGTARLVKTAAKAAPIAIGAYSTVSNWDRLKELKNKWDNGTITNAEKRELSYLVQTASGTVVGTKYASAGAAKRVASNGHTKIGKTLAFASDPLGVTYSSTFGKGNYTNDLVTTLKPVGDGKAHFEFTDSKGTRHSVSPLQYKAMIDARAAAIKSGKEGLDIPNAMLDAWAKNGPEGTYYKRTTTGIDNAFKFNDLNLNSTILNALKSKKDATKPLKISDDIELSVEQVNQLRKAYQELKNKSDVKAIINRLNKELKNMNLPNRTNEPAINPNAPVLTAPKNATSKLNRLRNYVDRNRENEMFGMKDVKEFKEGHMDLFDQSTENGIYNRMLLDDIRSRYYDWPIKWKYFKPNYEIGIEPYPNATRTPYDTYLENLEKLAKELYNNSRAHKQGGKLETLKILRQGGEINFTLPSKMQQGGQATLDSNLKERVNLLKTTTWDPTKRYHFVYNDNPGENELILILRNPNGTDNVAATHDENSPKNNYYDIEKGWKEAEQDIYNAARDAILNDPVNAEAWARYYKDNVGDMSDVHAGWFNPDGSFNHENFKLTAPRLWKDKKNGIGHDIFRGKTYFVREGVNGPKHYYDGRDTEFMKHYTISKTPDNNPVYNYIDEYELIAKPTDAQGDGLSKPDQQEGDKPQGGSQIVDASQIETKPEETEPLSHWIQPYKYNDYLADAVDLSGLTHSLWTNNRIAQIAKTKVPVLSSPKIGFKSIYGDFAALLHYNKQAADTLSKARRLADGTANTEAGFATWLDAQRIANLLKETGHKVDNDMIRKDMAESDAIRRNVYDYNHDKGDANLASLTAQINYAKDIEQGRLNANFTSLNNYRMGLVGNLRHRFQDWQQRAGKLYLLRMLLWAKDQINNDPEYKKLLDAYEADPNNDKNLTALTNYQRNRQALLLPYINRQYMNLYAGKYTDDNDFKFIPYVPMDYEAKTGNKPKSERRGGRIVVDSSRMKYRADDLRELRKLIRTNIRASLHALDNVSRATLLELKKMMGI